MDTKIACLAKILQYCDSKDGTASPEENFVFDDEGQTELSVMRFMWGLRFMSPSPKS